MDHAGGNIDPQALVARLPDGMHIPRLRDRLRTIISDHTAQTTLRQGCAAILRADCMHLVQRLHRQLTQALPSFHAHMGGRRQQWYR